MFPKEWQTSLCPKCQGDNLVLTCRMPAFGTGPNGRPRMGDSGFTEIKACGYCHAASDGLPYYSPEEIAYNRDLALRIRNKPFVSPGRLSR